MAKSLIRLASLAVVLMTAEATGIGQEAIRRAEPAGSRAQFGSGIAASGVPVPPTTTYDAASPLVRRSPVDPNKRLAVGDQVSIEIQEDRDGPIAKIITDAGDLDVPPLGRVKIAGKTTSEAEALIKARLEEDYYYKATVRLSIDRVNERASIGKVHVQGEVRAPQTLQVIQGDRLTVNEAILRCGNFSQFAKAEKVVVTRQKNGKPPQRFTVNVKDIQRKGLLENDMLLEDGDSVFVPKSWFRLSE